MLHILLLSYEIMKNLLKKIIDKKYLNSIFQVYYAGQSGAAGVLLFCHPDDRDVEACYHDNQDQIELLIQLRIHYLVNI